MSDTPESESESKTTEPKGGRPGPADSGGSGGMASREMASDEAGETD